MVHVPSLGEKIDISVQVISFVLFYKNIMIK